MHTSIEDYRLLRKSEVLRLCALSRSGLYAKIKAGEFPRPVRLGPRAVAWREKEVRDWIESRPPSVDNRPLGV